MKAGVIHNWGEIPQYIENSPIPTPALETEVLISMKAAAIKNLDKMIVAGQHYSVATKLKQPKIVGTDGVGELEDGKRVYAMGKYGMVAEKVIVDKNALIPVPSHLDISVAAALPNAVLGAYMPLKFKAQLQKGETVLIHGATGITGRIAIQLAKIYGAKRIIATGRDENSLKVCQELGADEIIHLHQDVAEWTQQLAKIHHETPISVVIDYIWGKSTEHILNTLKGRNHQDVYIRYVTVGGMGGDNIQLSSSILRSTQITIQGSGLGTWSQEEMLHFSSIVLPQMFQLAVENKLKIETETVDLKDISKFWNSNIEKGKRLVIKI